MFSNVNKRRIQINIPFELYSTADVKNKIRCEHCNVIESYGIIPLQKIEFWIHMGNGKSFEKLEEVKYYIRLQKMFL